MKRVLAAALLVTACNRGQSQVTIGVGAVTTVVGGVVTWAELDAGNPPVLGGTVMLTGLALVAIGIVGTLSHEPERPASVRRVDPTAKALLDQERAAKQLADEEHAERIRVRDTAWKKTREAADAARLNQCEAVKAIEFEVKTIDAEFHATVFVRDAAIARCLAAPGH